MNNRDLIGIFGLLHAELLPVPDGREPDQIFNLDHFTVKTFGETAVFVCKCARTEPFALSEHLIDRIKRICGTYACPICVQELKSARSGSGKVRVWFNQNRSQLTPEAHLYLPTGVVRLIDLQDKTIMRPRRFIFSNFYNVELRQKDKILNTCGDPNCVNPYHMMRAASAAAKVTPAMREDVLHWSYNQIKPQEIRELLQKKYQITISLRTITNIKKSSLA